MTTEQKSVAERIRELEEECADEIEEAQSQPGLKDFLKLVEATKRYRDGDLRSEKTRLGQS